VSDPSVLSDPRDSPGAGPARKVRPMHTSTTRRGTAFRWLAAFGLALVILPALSSDASAQFRRGGFYGRGYRGFGPRVYSRGYGFAPRVYSRGYGFAPRAYGPRYGFYNYGVPFRSGYRSPFVGPGFRMGFGGYPY
jgi:hypothetical protein